MRRRRESPEMQLRAPIRARRVADLMPRSLETAIARRAGMNIDLIAAWPGIAGPAYCDCTLPEKIRWPRRASEDDPFRPGQLVVACDGARAVFFQHEIPQILERVNQFFGFHAVAEVRIVQKPVSPNRSRTDRKPPQLDEASTNRLQGILDRIEDPQLRESVRKLGTGVLAAKAARRR